MRYHSRPRALVVSETSKSGTVNSCARGTALVPSKVRKVAPGWRTRKLALSLPQQTRWRHRHWQGSVQDQRPREFGNYTWISWGNGRCSQSKQRLFHAMLKDLRHYAPVTGDTWEYNLKNEILRFAFQNNLYFHRDNEPNPEMPINKPLQQCSWQTGRREKEW